MHMDVPTAARPRRRLLAAVLFLFATAPYPAWAEVYTWTDAQGTLHFSDKPPIDGTADRVRLQPTNTFRGAPAETAPGDQAQRPANTKSVVMFSAEWCGYCRKARHYLQANGVAFRERDVEKDPAARREYDRLGGSGLPLILVGDQRLRGFSEEGFRRLYGN
jgi:glutaredoxin